MTDNAIVLENLKPGTPRDVWDASSSTMIEGFAADISYDIGQTVQFKINVNAVPSDQVPYRIEIYRLGYYGGDGATLVTTLTNADGTVQPNPITDSRGLVDAGNWSVTDTWSISEDAVSGVYLAKLQRLDANGDPIDGATNQIPFIIRDDTPADGTKSDIIFQTSDTTWQAYNGWAGNNGQVGADFYGDASGTINHPDVPDPGLGAQDRAYAVSYNRPFITRDGTSPASGAQDYLFGADYAAIYWLEKNGYDVSYISGVDTDRLGAANLIGHKAYISVGHDEYWSGPQRENVEAARDAGVNLLFWSGNEVYWKTRYEPSIDGSNTDYRTLVSYKETWANGNPNAGPENYANIDPSNEWTGTWRDLRFVDSVDVNGVHTAVGAKPENALTGQLFGPDGTGEPGGALDIPASFAGLRVWRDTGVAQTGTLDIAPGILGYEWDTSPEDQFRPAGLIKLSETTIPWSAILVDQGNQVQPGTATHNLSLYRADSGALVFGAGTVFWSWGLSDEHDSSPYGGNIANVAIQQFTINMFADMGIQPGVADAILATQGLVRAIASSDTVAATTTLVDLQDVSASQTVTITGTATDDDGNAATADGKVAVVEVSVDGGATWRVAEGTSNWSYQWHPTAVGDYTIMARAIDDSLNIASITPATDTVHVTAPETFSLFGAVTVTGSLATDATVANPAEIGVRFTAHQPGEITELKYYRATGDASDEDVRVGRLWSSDGTVLATVTFTSAVGEDGWQVATLSSPVAILANTEYVVSYRTNDNYFAVNGFFNPATEQTYDGLDDNAFTDPFGVLSAPESTVVTGPGLNGNGVYKYGAAVVLPNETFSASNYWVDVTFNPFDGVNTPPSFTSAASFNVAENQTAAGTLTATDAEGNALVFAIAGGADAAKFTINPTTGALTFNTAPDFEAPADSGGNNVYDLTVNVSDGIAPAVTQDITVSVTDLVEGQLSNLFGPAEAPATFITDAQDSTDYELGVKFEATQSSVITALRYFRGEVDADDTDIRTLNLWEADGDLLGSVTVTSGLNAIGWQVGTLTTPIAIQANTIYIASYGTTENYAFSGGYFTTDHTGPDGILTAPESGSAGGNGVFNFQQGPGFFPTGTFNATNYWVDVFFEPQSTPNTPPQITSNGGGDTAAISVFENSTLVTILTATDADVPVQPLIFAKIGGEDSSLFQIVNGNELRFISAPDFESLPSPGPTPGYQVSVQVADGNDGFDEQDITVTIGDVAETALVGFNGKAIHAQYLFDNDAPFDPPAVLGDTQDVVGVDGAGPEVVALAEQAGNPDSVGNSGLGLVDIDFEGSEIFYSFPVASNLPQPLPLVPFVFNGPLISDQVDGLRPILSAELVGQSGFIGNPNGIEQGDITVTDNSIYVYVGGTQRIDGATLHLHVTFANQVPVITSGDGAETATITVDENLTAVTTVTATDGDAVDTRTFSITGGEDSARFAINPATGELMFNSAPDAENPPNPGATPGYQVQVQVADGYGGIDTQLITVSLTDQNDNAPVFTSSATPSVAENITTVVDLTASDADTVGGPTTFSITGGLDAAQFQIAADGHTLEFVSAKDFEADAHSYAVQVTASDGSNTTPQDITVTLTDENDSAPVITSANAFSVAENATSVGTVTATDADSASVTFAITGGADQGLFAIDANTGALSFAAARDYETQAHSYQVEVTANDGSNASTAQLITVSLTDQNDNAPVFTSSATPSVAENITTVVDLTASDADTVGGPTTFSITGGLDAAQFQIAADGHTLEFVSAKDFEADAHSYAVQVTASDGSNTTPQDITVTLTDENDSAPVITSANAFSVAENATSVGTVTATDADSASVTFAITGGADQGLFAIDANTGALSFAAARDYETQAHSYQVEVTANDGSNASTAQLITVSLTDQNDNAPVFTSSATPSVAENITTVVDLTASDADTVGGPTTFSITGGLDAAQFQIAADGHTLEFVSAKDFEADAHSYAVQVTASDGSNTTPQDITVTLTDENDSAPVITSANAFSVAENATSVGTVTATDADSASVTFAITGGADQGLFAIDANTGALSFAAARDYETQAHSYQVEVTANDGSNASTAQLITVSLTDQNDNAPVFTSSATPSVAENITTVVDLTASDADTVGGPTTFSITGGLDAAQFQIAADGHTLEFVSAKDFEADAHSYAVQVTASDGSNTTPQDITVTLTDENDSAPVITSANAFSVAENATSVGTVTATDADSASVTFAITGGADQGLFAIDANTGALSFAAARDYETQAHSYQVEVTANDGSNASTAQLITVSLTDQNDNAPVFTSSATPSVAENITTVVDLTASDADTVGGPTTFSITGGLDAAQFQIAADGHTLEFVSAKDFEADAHSYAVQVTASDGSNTTPQDITVTLTDENDSAPVITSANAFSVAENATSVGTVTATDADSASVTFAITGGADQGLFAIDANTGALSFAAARDYETQAHSYQVEVTANDGSNASTAQLITVSLTDQNDNAPVFTSSATPSVAENITTVVDLTASDADTVGGPTTFSITGGLDAAQFQIAADGHTLEFVSAKDFEADAHSYAVQVTASDGSNTTPQDITVTLTDENDSAPVITSANAFSVAENATSVGTVTATDADSASVTFAITGGADQGLFAIDANTGALSFAAARDYETQAHSYQVEVTANDGSNASTAQLITVSLTDQNDNAPVFTSSATPSVAENITTVVDLTASDADTVGGPTTFSITGGLDAAQFQIAADGHTLEFVSAKDFEADAHSYAVQVTASDGSNTTPQDITVTLTDENEGPPPNNPPSITSNGSGATATISIVENAFAVTTVTATDPEGTLPIYSISGGADAAKFNINTATGALAFAVAPDFETPTDTGADNSYEVIVRASDGSLFDEQTLTVNVTNVLGITVNGTSGNNVINGTGEEDILNGLGGNDQIHGLGGNDFINGGSGNDQLFGDAGNDTFVIAGTEAQGDAFNGGDGNDAIQVIGSGLVTLAGFNATASSIEIWQGNGQGVLGTSASNTFNLSGLTAMTDLAFIDGGGGNDIITGSSFADDLRGGAGNDTLNGGEGNDTLTGGAGKDALNGGNGDDNFVIAGTDGQNDTFDGGAGTNSILVAGSGAVTLAGFNAATSSIKTWQGNGQALLGTSANNNFDLAALIAISGLLYVDGGSGNDAITGSAFADDLRGGAGIDTLNGGEGNDTLTGGAGNDGLYGGNGNDNFIIAGTDAQSDSFDGGAGTDGIVVTGSGAVTLAGFDAAASSIETWQGNGQGMLGTGAANTLNLSGLTTVSGLTFVAGGGGNDIITGSSFADDLRGGNGDDTLNGADGNDTLTGGAGNDTLHGGNDNDTFVISGTDGQNDIFDGGLGTDSILVTGSGAVTLAGFNAIASSIETWQGNGQGVLGTGAANTLDFSGLTTVSGLAFVDGGGGNDAITGSIFADGLRGGNGNDTLRGGAGNDTLTGGAGNDTLIGGLGADTLNAGAGNDVIAYQFANEGGDLIQGYSVAADTLAFSAAGFGGNLTPNQQLVAGVTFIANTAPVAVSIDSTFLYDTDGHDLFWDADGSGTDLAVQIAHFDAAVALNANDFDIMA